MFFIHHTLVHTLRCATTISPEVLTVIKSLSKLIFLIGQKLEIYIIKIF